MGFGEYNFNKYFACNTKFFFWIKPHKTIKTISYIYSLLSRCSTARGSCSRLALGGPTKVTACESFLSTEGSLKVENNSNLRMERSLVKFVGFCTGWDQNGDRVFKNDESCH